MHSGDINLRLSTKFKGKLEYEHYSLNAVTYINLHNKEVHSLSFYHK